MEEIKSVASLSFVEFRFFVSFNLNILEKVIVLKVKRKKKNTLWHCALSFGDIHLICIYGAHKTFKVGNI